MTSTSNQQAWEDFTATLAESRTGPASPGSPPAGSQHRHAQRRCTCPTVPGTSAMAATCSCWRNCNRRTPGGGCTPSRSAAAAGCGRAAADPSPHRSAGPCTWAARGSGCTTRWSFPATSRRTSCGGTAAATRSGRPPTREKPTRRSPSRCTPPARTGAAKGPALAYLMPYPARAYPRWAELNEQSGDGATGPRTP